MKKEKGSFIVNIILLVLFSFVSIKILIWLNIINTIADILK
jgi:hypothetical protein